MKINDLRNLSKDDLSQKLAAYQEELHKLNYLKRVGQVEKIHQFKTLRRTIARIQTLLREVELTKKDNA